MKPTALFVITSDPRLSARPAEALRIAAGIGAWQSVEVTIYLAAAAVLVLSPEPDGHGLVEAADYRLYLSLVRDLGLVVFVQHGEPLLASMGEAFMPFQEINGEQLARHAARNQYVLRF
jgi:hypothetical protein